MRVVRIHRYGFFADEIIAGVGLSLRVPGAHHLERHFFIWECFTKTIILYTVRLFFAVVEFFQIGAVDGSGHGRVISL